MSIGALSFALTIQFLCEPLPTYKEYKQCVKRSEKCLQVTRNLSLSECVNFYPKKENKNGK